MCVTVGSFNAMRKKNVMCKQRGTLKQQAYYNVFLLLFSTCCTKRCFEKANSSEFVTGCICVLCDFLIELIYIATGMHKSCLLYTSPSPRDMYKSRMPSSA